MSRATPVDGRVPERSDPVVPRSTPGCRRLLQGLQALGGEGLRPIGRGEGPGCRTDAAQQTGPPTPPPGGILLYHVLRHMVIDV